MTDKYLSVFLEQAVDFNQGFWLVPKMGKDGVTDDGIKGFISQPAIFDIGA
jgi:hypothetical protein